MEVMKKVGKIVWRVLFIIFATALISIASVLLTLFFTSLLMGSFGVLVSGNISNWNFAILIFATALIGFLYVKLFSRAKKMKYQIAMIISSIALLSSPFVLTAVYSPTSFSPGEFKPAVGGDTFDFIQWHVRELSIEAADIFVFWDSEKELTQKEQSQFVLEYLESAKKEASLLKKELEQKLSPDEQAELSSLHEHVNKNEAQAREILASQIKAILTEEGIINPWDKTKTFFPPVNFRITKPPKILIVTHRDRLEEKSRIFLDPNLRLGEVEAIEQKVQDMGYSALVTGLGGLSTYPTTVVAGSPKRVIEIVAHEWLHNYISFTPLGMAKGTTERSVLEETAVSIIDKEIAQKLWDKYYAPFEEIEEAPLNTDTSPQVPDRIDFNEAMREIRLDVEELLKDGEVEEAEEYMAQKRVWLEQEGHYVRKLNQAYLTFKSFYATGKAYKDANEGAGSKLLKLRDSSSSIKDFLHIVTQIKTFRELDKYLELISTK